MFGGFNLTLFGEVSALVMLAAWLIFDGARTVAVWSEQACKVQELKSQQAQDAKALLKNVKEIQRLNDEIRDARAGIEATVQTAAAKRQALATFVPPAPSEIYVTSEFPYSKKSRAWVADIKLSDAAQARRSENGIARHLLVWAPDYASACNRAPRFIARKDYEVGRVRLLDP
ncbi:MAG: hypothetical protein JO128_12260 [Alphaproteobacteria bacterium]|nr:hypothetical protein [Alphaproteobacteria bacterium]